MIPPDALVLLDTNVLVELIRNRGTGQRINNELALSERPERPVISVVTVGELRAAARKFGWGPRKQSALSEFIRQLVVVDIRADNVLTNYAEIDHDSEREVKPARRMGQNDMWIAACAAAYGAHLVTSDNDFDHLTPRFLDRIKVDPHTGAILTDE